MIVHHLQVFHLKKIFYIRRSIFNNFKRTELTIATDAVVTETSTDTLTNKNY